MGFDCGFDICPPLEEKYRGVTDPDSRSPSGIVLITPETRHTEGSDKLSNDTKYFYYFMIGEAPHLPSHPDCCDRFLRFSSKVSGGITAPAEPYIMEVCRIAKQYFGDRVCFWHELRETGDEKQYGCYSWKRVYEAEKEVRDFHENMEKQSKQAFQRYSFVVGQVPELPSHPNCGGRLLGFNSYVSSGRTAPAGSYIMQVFHIAKQYFGNHELRETGDEKQYCHQTRDHVRAGERGSR
ncbi:hypothetical protein NM208_g14432 [Fusarium decemcellulare]|uniref:Uncharacterized protein n=1 Tax=Fusarium decemcellulare TaxID=57161 RepID=A0ACC1RG51_9HYPO|nr:hypothetical protein NM208_g14432 [Fusarium decemcellulare]